jgi:hypothetical protein
MLRSIVVVGTLASCAPSKPAHGDELEANEFALEPVTPNALDIAIAPARDAAQGASDAEGLKLLADLARRPPTNAAVALATCILRADDGPTRTMYPVDPNSPCDNPDLYEASIICCKRLFAGVESCGYCRDAAREDPSFSALAARYERQCEQENTRQRAAFERVAARSWLEWARSRDHAQENLARSALDRARVAMEAARAIDGHDDASLASEIRETGKHLNP